MEFNQQFFDEEILWDFKVTRKRKKIWATELNMLAEFDRICKKHDLTYFADSGTLLGAVRHQGFIPWDDDIDLTMFRPDYERMKEIMRRELPDYYELQDEKTEFGVQSFSQIRDRRTSAVQYYDAPLEYNQGIFIDIFPFDDACDTPDAIPQHIQMIFEFWIALSDYDTFQTLINQNIPFATPIDILKFAADDTSRQSIDLFNSFCLQNFGQTSKINYFTFEAPNPGNGYLREWYDEIVYLPFHDMMIPAPSRYEEVLTHFYGDYMNPVKGASYHEGIPMDPDTPYVDTIFNHWQNHNISAN